MNRIESLRRVLALVVLGVLVASLPAIAGCSRNDATQEGTPAAEQQTEDQAQDAAPAEDSDTDAVPEEMTVRLYFSSAGESAFGVERTIPYTQAVATAAMEQLLAGPTDAELTTWPALSSQIPAGTGLLGLTVEDGVAKVDLSGEFAGGGGTFSVTARLAQVVYTLCEFDTIDSVEFYMDGAKVTLFSGEGLELDGPQTPEDYYELLPIDA